MVKFCQSLVTRNCQAIVNALVLLSGDTDSERAQCNMLRLQGQSHYGLFSVGLGDPCESLLKDHLTRISSEESVI